MCRKKRVIQSLITFITIVALCTCTNAFVYAQDNTSIVSRTGTGIDAGWCTTSSSASFSIYSPNYHSVGYARISITGGSAMVYITDPNGNAILGVGGHYATEGTQYVSFNSSMPAGNYEVVVNKATGDSVTVYVTLYYGTIN